MSPGIWRAARGGALCPVLAGTALSDFAALPEGLGAERLVLEDKPFDRRLWGILNLELWYREFIDDSNRQSKIACLPSSAIPMVTTGP